MSTMQTPNDAPAAPSVSHYVDDAELALLLDHDHEEREADRRALPPLLVACCIAGIAIAVIALITAVFGLAATADDDAPAANPTQATMDHGTAAEREVDPAALRGSEVDGLGVATGDTLDVRRVEDRDKEGSYPFVTHAFGDMVKGAAGILHTTGAPMPKAGH